MKKLLILSFLSLFTFLNTQAQDTYWPTDISEINTGVNSTYLIQSATLDGASVIWGYVLGAFFVNDEGNLQCGGFGDWVDGQTTFAVMGDDTTTEEKDGFYDGEEITWLAYGTFAEQTYNATVEFSLTPPFGSNTFSTNGINIVTDFHISSTVLGCMETTACNYNLNATNQDYTCTYAEENYNCDGSCIDIDGDLVCDIYEILGCTDTSACNYNALTTEEDNTCTYAEPGLECGQTAVIGCIDLFACNYNELATVEGLCIYTTTECATCSGEVDGTGLVFLNDTDLDGVCDDAEINGCTDPLYIEYSEFTTEEDGSCIELVIIGCIDANAFNYNSSANTPNETCLYNVEVDFNTIGTTTTTSFSVTTDTINLTLGTEEITEGDIIGGFHIIDGQLVCIGYTAWTGNDFSLNLWLDDPATEEIDGLTDNSTIFWIVQQEETMLTYLVDLTLVYAPGVTFVTQITLNLTTIIGCMDPSALNFNPNANTDDGSCVAVVEGCTDATAYNYNELASTDDGSCIACPYDIFTEYSSTADIYDVALCQTLIVEGCTDFSYMEYYSEANTDDGSCNNLVVLGCMDTLYIEYNASANTDNSSCVILIISGCTDSDYLEYNPLANTVDIAACVNLVVIGCTDITMFNYSEEANTDDYSCYPYIMGCMDVDAFNFIVPTNNPQIDVNTDDASCIYSGCTNLFANNYDMLATIDDGSCFINGCTLDVFPNYNSQATIDDFSCDMNSLDVYGCTDEGSDNYNTEANQDIGTCYKFGCTSDWADNYDELATDDDGSCFILGCTSDWADNFDPFATLSISEIPEQFSVNTGTNMTVMLTPDFINSLNITNENAYIVASASSGVVVGSSDLYGFSQKSMAIWGDDTQTSELDGALAYESISFQLVNGVEVYDLVMANPVSYVTNDLSVQTSSAILNLDNGCIRLGCTSDWADNYDELATDDDGSCFILGCTSVWADNYDSNATSNDGSCTLIGCTDENYLEYNPQATYNNDSCNTLIVYGCTNIDADNFDSLAHIDNYSCVFTVSIDDWGVETVVTDNNMSVVFPAGTLSGFIGGHLMVFDELGIPIPYPSSNSDWEIYADGSSGIAVAGTDALCGCDYASLGDELSFAILMNGESIVNIDVNPTITYTANGFELVNADLIFSIDGDIVVFGCMDAAYLEFDASAHFDDNSCSTIIIDGCIDYDACNYIYEANLDDGSCFYTDGVCETCVDGVIVDNDVDNDGVCDDDEVYGCTDASAYNFDVSATNDDESCTYTVIGCTNVSDCNYNALATIDDGSCIGEPGCLDLFYVEYSPLAGCSLESACQTSWIQLYDSLQVESNIVLQELINTNLTLDSLNYLNGSLSEELESWSSPIVIDLILGWNMIGYTYKEPQDVVATLQVIEDVILIVKNNAAEVYWPEYGFNGIGNLIPGQGYQIKVSEGYSGFTYPNVNGERIELTPTVPQWAIDMEVEMHPNDIRTLVKVVNMLGQEINPENQPSGTVLLYLYNDASVEKKIK